MVTSKRHPGMVNKTASAVEVVTQSDTESSACKGRISHRHDVHNVVDNSDSLELRSQRKDKINKNLMLVKPMPWNESRFDGAINDYSDYSESSTQGEAPAQSHQRRWESPMTCCFAGGNDESLLRQEESEGDETTVHSDDQSVISEIPNPRDVFINEVYIYCGPKTISDVLDWANPATKCFAGTRDDDSMDSY